MGTKGEETRERLIEAAVLLFAERGYEATTLKAIAERADRSPGLVYRYFSRKEDLVLALYASLAEELVAFARALPPGNVSARVRAVLDAKLHLVRPYRRSLGALAAAAVDPEDPLGVMSEGTFPIREAVRGAFDLAVRGAADAPAHPDPVVRAIYMAHLLVLLLWLQDRSPDEAPTRAAIGLLEDLLRLPLDGPFAALALARLDTVMRAMLEPS